MGGHSEAFDTLLTTFCREAPGPAGEADETNPSVFRWPSEAQSRRGLPWDPQLLPVGQFRLQRNRGSEVSPAELPSCWVFPEEAPSSKSFGYHEAKPNVWVSSTGGLWGRFGGTC